MPSVPPVAEDPLEIDGIDIKSALKRTGGNRQRYERLLRQFAQQQAATVKDIRTALSMGDAATAERAAHSLKGAAGTLGVNAPVGGGGQGRDCDQDGAGRRQHPHVSRGRP